MPKKILIVEDNELNMKLMSDILTAYGYLVFKASDGEAALHLIADDIFDLILLDLQLPKVSGYEVLKKIHTHTPIVVVSACCTEEEISKAKLKGCIDFISKPIIVNDFLSKVRLYLKD